MNDGLNNRVFPIGKITTLFLCIFFIIEIFIIFGGLESKNKQINDKIDSIIKINANNYSSEENFSIQEKIINMPEHESSNSNTNSVIKENFEILNKEPVG